MQDQPDTGGSHVRSADADDLAGDARLYDVIGRGKFEWEQTVDAITDTIAVFDAEGRLMRGNIALANHHKWPLTTLKGRPCRDACFCGGQEEKCAVRRAIVTGETRREEVTLATGDIYLVTTLPIAGGRSAAAAAQIAKNVTTEVLHARALCQVSEELALANHRLTMALDQVKAMQARAIQTEKLSSLGHLVAGVAHEVNNPLTSITGYTQLVASDLEDHLDAGEWVAAARQDVARIASETARAAKIVSDLLAFARRQSADRTAQNLSELVGRVLALRNYELGRAMIALGTDFSPDLRPVMANANQIQEVVLSLLLNAEQALKVRAEGRQLQLATRFEPRSHSVVVEISDNGAGIAADHVSRVFDPFFTTRNVGEGAGLGLSASYGIVRDHGGEISVESEPHVRTTFRMRFPAVLPESAPRHTVVVIQSDDTVGETLASTVNGWGHRAVLGQEPDPCGAVASARPDVVLVDRRRLAEHLPTWGALYAQPCVRPRLVDLGPPGDGNAATEEFLRHHRCASVSPPYDLAALYSALGAAEEH